MLQDIKKILLAIKLSPKEVDVLYLLLQYSPMKVADLAQKTRLNRTTIYGILKKLSTRGLVSSRERFGITEFISIDPVLLPSFLEQQREVLRTLQDEIKPLLSELSEARDNIRGLPKFQIFEGWDGLKQAYEDTLENNIGGVIWDFTSPGIIYENLDNVFMEYYMSKRAKLGIKCIQVASSDSWSKKTVDEDKKFLRHTMLIPPQFQFYTEFIIY
ncbi:MAG: MarR family transcriptional regulator, partial [Candidatus Magasanikbacteria bacterium]|nr:MarR family transcriptional regulator [Candidatus Magasanikbacteria bacterium]